MYYWLEQETRILKELCCYNYSANYQANLIWSGSVEPSDEAANVVTSNQQQQQQEPLEEASLLHEQVTFQAKVQRLAMRKEWLRSNELLLRTFLSYCNLHSASGSKIFFSI